MHLIFILWTQHLQVKIVIIDLEIFLFELHQHFVCDVD